MVPARQVGSLAVRRLYGNAKKAVDSNGVYGKITRQAAVNRLPIRTVS